MIKGQPKDDLLVFHKPDFVEVCDACLRGNHAACPCVWVEQDIKLKPKLCQCVCTCHVIV